MVGIPKGPDHKQKGFLKGFKPLRVLEERFDRLVLLFSLRIVT
jgi:hypothetical protein